MADSFSVGKDTIQIPYRRFLADSSAGFIFILLALASYYLPLFGEEPLRQALHSRGVIVAAGAETKVFVFVALFLLATPLGFVVNGVSWMILSQPLDVVERACYKIGHRKPPTVFPIADISASRYAHALASQFDISPINFAQQVSFLRQSLDTPALAEIAPESQTRGLLILLRNGALFAYTAGMFSVYGAFPAVCQAVLVALAVALTTIALMLPWSGSTFLRAWAIVAAIAAIGTFIVALIVALKNTPDHRLAIQAIGLVVAATVLLLISGVIGYYNSCWVILHVYFITVVLGVAKPLEQEWSKTTLATITRAVQRASVKSRGRTA